MHTEFRPVSLEGIKGVTLLNRHDTKFVFNINRLPEVLRQLKQQYHVLEVEGHRVIRYQNVYYDTADFSLYTSHHNGKMNRYKIRIRKYVENDVNFFEVKLKNNKGRTIKKRVQTRDFETAIRKDGNALLNEHTPFTRKMLQPVIRIDFSRITLAHKGFLDRLTIDFDLTVSQNGNQTIFEPLAIAELKQDRQGMKSPFLLLMKQLSIREMRVSKYCLGMAHFHKELKHNRFKERFLRINKIMYGRTA